MEALTSSANISRSTPSSASSSHVSDISATLQALDASLVELEKGRQAFTEFRAKVLETMQSARENVDDSQLNSSHLVSYDASAAVHDISAVLHEQQQQQEEEEEREQGGQGSKAQPPVLAQLHTQQAAPAGMGVSAAAGGIPASGSSLSASFALPPHAPQAHAAAATAGGTGGGGGSSDPVLLLQRSLSAVGEAIEALAHARDVREVQQGAGTAGAGGGVRAHDGAAAGRDLTMSGLQPMAPPSTASVAHSSGVGVGTGGAGGSLMAAAGVGEQALGASVLHLRHALRRERELARLAQDEQQAAAASYALPTSPPMQRHGRGGGVGGGIPARLRGPRFMDVRPASVAAGMQGPSVGSSAAGLPAPGTTQHTQQGGGRLMAGSPVGSPVVAPGPALSTSRATSARASLLQSLSPAAIEELLAEAAAARAAGARGTYSAAAGQGWGEGYVQPVDHMAAPPPSDAGAYGGWEDEGQGQGQGRYGAEQLTIARQRAAIAEAQRDAALAQAARSACEGALSESRWLHAVSSAQVDCMTSALSECVTNLGASAAGTALALAQKEAQVAALVEGLEQLVGAVVQGSGYHHQDKDSSGDDPLPSSTPPTRPGLQQRQQRQELVQPLRDALEGVERAAAAAAAARRTTTTTPPLAGGGARRPASLGIPHSSVHGARSPSPPPSAGKGKGGMQRVGGGYAYGVHMGGRLGCDACPPSSSSAPAPLPTLPAPPGRIHYTGPTPMTQDSLSRARERLVTVLAACDPGGRWASASESKQAQGKHGY